MKAVRIAIHEEKSYIFDYEFAEAMRLLINFKCSDRIILVIIAYKAFIKPGAVPKAKTQYLLKTDAWLPLFARVGMRSPLSKTCRTPAEQTEVCCRDVTGVSYRR